MMKTIIFDLKNTLVNPDGLLMKNTEAALAAAQKSADRTILYTMNEAWTYGVLNAYPRLWRPFSMLVIVDKKRRSDLEPFQEGAVIVVGDSLTEELAFAEQLGYESLRVKTELPLAQLASFLGEPS